LGDYPHQPVFLDFGVPTSGEREGVNPDGTKSQVLQTNNFRGLPLQDISKKLKTLDIIMQY